MASDATGLRDVLVGVDREPAVLGITVAEIEESKAECREALERMERAVRDRDEARGERDEARAERDNVSVEAHHWMGQAARYREALERITAAHVAGASAGELADRARGVLRGGGGHDGEQAAVLERDEARARAKKADEALAFWQRGAKDAARYQEALEQIRDGRWNQPGERLTAREFARDALGGGDD